MIKLLHNLWRKRSGTASIEFAFALPALLALFLGVFEVSQALIMYMKVIDVADTVSDLVAQQKTVTTTDIDNYYLAGQLVMTPSAPAGLALAVASVIFDPITGLPVPIATVVVDPISGKSEQGWQVTEGGAAVMTDADLAAASAGLGNKGESVIVAQASYTYNSALGYLLHQGITMTARVFSRPRAVFVIPCSSSPCNN